jgi:hypothetical protein
LIFSLELEAACRTSKLAEHPEQLLAEHPRKQRQAIQESSGMPALPSLTRAWRARSHPTPHPTLSQPQTSPGRAVVRSIANKRHALLAGHYIRQSRVVPVRPEEDRRQQQTNTITVRRTSSGSALSLSRALASVGAVLMCKITSQPAAVMGLGFRV